jgi:hypothetical protein
MRNAQWAFEDNTQLARHYIVTYDLLYSTGIDVTTLTSALIDVRDITEGIKQFYIILESFSDTPNPFSASPCRLGSN